ncbi:MAG: DMT family transporter [Tissierellia bacterium]|nr:DMT family transporter [Tissierellia bacterium]
MNQKTFLCYMAALGYAAIIGFSFIFVKGILTQSDPLNILAIRFTLAFLPLLGMYPFMRKKCNFQWHRLRKLLVAGLFYPLIFFTFQAFALNISSSIEVGAVQATTPIFTLIMAGLFLKEKTNVMQRFSVIICVLGVLYIMIMKFIKNVAPDFSGIGVAFIGTLGLATYTILTKKIKHHYSNYEVLFIIVGEAFVLLLGAAIIKNAMAGTLPSLWLPLQQKDFLVSVCYLAFLSTVASGFLINFALSHIDASKMIVFNNLGTVIQILAGVIILKETLFPSHIIGSILIILGILGVNLLGQVEDVKYYIPKFWVILSVLNFITGIFTFFMGSQNMSSHYIGSEHMEKLSADAIHLAELGNSYAMSFYLMALLFILSGVGFAILYYVSSHHATSKE